MVDLTAFMIMQVVGIAAVWALIILAVACLAVAFWQWQG